MLAASSQFEEMSGENNNIDNNYDNNNNYNAQHQWFNYTIANINQFAKNQPSGFAKRASYMSRLVHEELSGTFPEQFRFDNATSSQTEQSIIDITISSDRLALLLSNGQLAKLNCKHRSFGKQKQYRDDIKQRYTMDHSYIPPKISKKFESADKRVQYEMFNSRLIETDEEPNNSSVHNIKDNIANHVHQIRSILGDIDDNLIKSVLAKNNNNMNLSIMDILSIMFENDPAMTNKALYPDKLNLNNCEMYGNKQHQSGQNKETDNILSPAIHPNVKFRGICSTSTDIYALSNSGEIYVWPWQSSRSSIKPLLQVFSENHTYIAKDKLKLIENSEVKLINSSLLMLIILFNTNDICVLFDPSMRLYCGNTIDNVHFLRMTKNRDIVNVRAINFNLFITTGQNEFYCVDMKNYLNIEDNLSQSRSLDALRYNKGCLVARNELNNVSSFALMTHGTGIPRFVQLVSKKKISYKSTSLRKIRFMMNGRYFTSYWPANDILFIRKVSNHSSGILKFYNGNDASKAAFVSSSINNLNKKSDQKFIDSSDSKSKDVSCASPCPEVRNSSHLHASGYIQISSEHIFFSQLLLQSDQQIIAHSFSQNHLFILFADNTSLCTFACISIANSTLIRSAAVSPELFRLVKTAQSPVYMKTLADYMIDVAFLLVDGNLYNFSWTEDKIINLDRMTVKNVKRIEIFPNITTNNGCQLPNISIWILKSKTDILEDIVKGDLPKVRSTFINDHSIHIHASNVNYEDYSYFSDYFSCRIGNGLNLLHSIIFAYYNCTSLRPKIDRSRLNIEDSNFGSKSFKSSESNNIGHTVRVKLAEYSNFLSYILINCATTNYYSRLVKLLIDTDSHGRTPFHYAIIKQCNKFAIQILECICTLYKSRKCSIAQVQNMICHNSSDLLKHPLTVLTYGSKCLQQFSIQTYTCLTCDMKCSSLCSVCAVSCHYGHDLLDVPMSQTTIGQNKCGCGQTICQFVNQSCNEQSNFEVIDYIFTNFPFVLKSLNYFAYIGRLLLSYKLFMNKMKLSSTENQTILRQSQYICRIFNIFCANFQTLRSNIEETHSSLMIIPNSKKYLLQTTELTIEEFVSIVYYLEDFTILKTINETLSRAHNSNMTPSKSDDAFISRYISFVTKMYIDHIIFSSVLQTNASVDIIIKSFFSKFYLTLWHFPTLIIDVFCSKLNSLLESSASSTDINLNRNIEATSLFGNPDNLKFFMPNDYLILHWILMIKQQASTSLNKLPSSSHNSQQALSALSNELGSQFFTNSNSPASNSPPMSLNVQSLGPNSLLSSEIPQNSFSAVNQPAAPSSNYIIESLSHGANADALNLQGADGPNDEFSRSAFTSVTNIQQSNLSNNTILAVLAALSSFSSNLPDANNVQNNMIDGNELPNIPTVPELVSNSHDTASSSSNRSTSQETSTTSSTSQFSDDPDSVGSQNDEDFRISSPDLPRFSINSNHWNTVDHFTNVDYELQSNENNLQSANNLRNINNFDSIMSNVILNRNDFHGFGWVNDLQGSRGNNGSTDGTTSCRLHGMNPGAVCNIAYTLINPQRLLFSHLFALSSKEIARSMQTRFIPNFFLDNRQHNNHLNHQLNIQNTIHRVCKTLLFNIILKNLLNILIFADLFEIASDNNSSLQPDSNSQMKTDASSSKIWNSKNLTLFFDKISSNIFCNLCRILSALDSRLISKSRNAIPQPIDTSKNLGLSDQLYSFINDASFQFTANLSGIINAGEEFTTRSPHGVLHSFEGSEQVGAIILLDTYIVLKKFQENIVEKKSLINGFKFHHFTKDLTPGYRFSPPATDASFEMPLAKNPHMINEINSSKRFFGLTKHSFQYNINYLPSLPLEAVLLKYQKIIKHIFKSRLKSLPDCNSLLKYHYLDIGEKSKILSSLIFWESCGKRKGSMKLRLQRNCSGLVNETFSTFNEYFSGPNAIYHHQRTRNSSKLFVFNLKVKFRDELGEGIGVTNSFFILISEFLMIPFDLSTFEPKLYHDKSESEFIDMKKFTNSNVATQLPSKFSKTTITRSPDTKLRDLLNKDGSLTTNNSLGILESYVTQCLDISRISYDEIKNSLLDKNFIECISLFQTSDFQSCAHPSGSISHAGSSDSLYENFKTIFANAMSHGSEICNNESLLSFELSHCDSSLFIPSPNGVSAVPRPAAVSRKRLNLYRNVGRLIGIALREKTQTVFNFSRHVFKYLLGHRLEFHDLAFHDREVYNALSGIMNQHKEGLDGFDIESLGLNFTCELSKGEGSGLMLLCENGDKTPVTSKNFKLFLELYCLHRMIYLVEPALVEMKKGLNETIPHGLLDFLSPVDLQLLLVCTSSIDVDLLIKSITFRDESKQSHATIERYKIWFVSLLKKFPQNKIKSLLSFWTSVPNILRHDPEFLTIVLTDSSNSQLPTSNTCIRRMYLPLYSTIDLLYSKLNQAIKVTNFGFI